MSEDLSPRQAEALEFIKEVSLRNGRPPTIREIGDALGISSTNGVRYFLGVLERKGLIERARRVSRGIRVMKQHSRGRVHRQKVIPLRERTIEVPLVGRVAAGEPVLAEQNIEDILRLDNSFFHTGDGSFALRVKGDSMVGAGILEGDLVIVKPDVRPETGDIVVAYWEEEATVKRYYRRGKNVVLRPENDDYEEITIDPRQEDFRVLGKVVGLIRRS